jgi:hypothetical protein
MDAIPKDAQSPLSGIPGATAVARPGAEYPGHNEAVDFFKEETDVQIADASDNYQSLLDTARRGLGGNISAAKAEQGLLVAVANGQIEGEVGDAAAIQRSLLDRATRVVTANTQSASGSYALSFPIDQGAESTGAVGTAPGISPPVPTQGGGPLNLGGQCLVHLLPTEQRSAWTTLGQLIDGSIWVFAGPLQGGTTPYKPIYRFHTWYAAELACRLGQDCGWSLEKLTPWFQIIDQVTLVTTDDTSYMGAFCGTAENALTQFAASLKFSTPSVPPGRAIGGPIPVAGIPGYHQAGLSGPGFE